MRKDARILSLVETSGCFVVCYIRLYVLTRLYCMSVRRGVVDVQGLYRNEEIQITSRANNHTNTQRLLVWVGVLRCEFAKDQNGKNEIVLCWMKGFYLCLTLSIIISCSVWFCSVLFSSLPFTAKMNLKLTHITVLIGLNDAHTHYTLYHTTPCHTKEIPHSFIPSSRHPEKRDESHFLAFGHAYTHRHTKTFSVRIVEYTINEA